MDENPFLFDFAETMSDGTDLPPNSPSTTLIQISGMDDFEIRQRKFSLSNPPMPWFGLDIGGTLVKLVYFEPTDHEDFTDGSLDGEKETIAKIGKYLTSNVAYGDTGIRDSHLELTNQEINCRLGTLHFVRFPTSRMSAFLQLAKKKGLASLSSTVCATGGGSHKFAGAIKDELNLRLFRFDELESVIHGIEFIVSHHPQECYYWEKPLEEGCTTVALPTGPLSYPYLVVNIGSGVSILSVNGNRQFKRVSGSSIGGGMFHGLCCLLTGCETFEEALQLAANGNNQKVDKLVRDIYGGDYNLFGLPGDTVAASFGQMIAPEHRKDATIADLARAALVTVANNIGSVARLCARAEGIQRVLFVGNFLRVNEIASKRLAHAMDFWSQGTMKALFLNHEGYFGAAGCLLEMMRISERRREERLNAQECQNICLMVPKL